MSAGEPPLFGPYRILARLGEGGMGTVDLAEDTRLGRQVALKRLKLDEPGGAVGVDAATRARFEEEIRAASRLEHPGIAKVYEVGSIDGQPYFTMELLVGRPLDQVLAEERLGPVASARLVLELARALEHAHGRGVVHRDVKPSNVLVDDEYNPRLVDFGLAKRMIDPGRLTRTGVVIGTPQFMAPEQLEPDFGAIGPHTDVYGLGGVLHACLTGEPPNAGATEVEVFYRLVTLPAPSPRRFDRRIPSRLSAICRKALGRKPARRYASARELADELEGFLRTAAGAEVARGARRLRVAAGLAAALVTVGLTIRLASPAADPPVGAAAGGGAAVAPADLRAQAAAHLQTARRALGAGDLRKAEALARLARAVDPSAGGEAGAILEQVGLAGTRWLLDGRARQESDLAADTGRVAYQGWFYRPEEARAMGLVTAAGRCESWVELFLTGRAGTDETQEELPAPVRFRLDRNRPVWEPGPPR